jgi:fatty-acyl-CoA synthase
MPDPKWGELGVAVVVCRPKFETTPNELIKHLDGKLARYKWPRHVVFWDALPKSAYGKITKKDVRAQLTKEWEQICMGNERNDAAQTS